MKIRSIDFLLLSVTVVLFSAAMVIRIFDAFSQGDVWLAFSRRSDVGFPFAQILALGALVTTLFGAIITKRRRIRRE